MFCEGVSVGSVVIVVSVVSVSVLVIVIVMFGVLEVVVRWWLLCLLKYVSVCVVRVVLGVGPVGVVDVVGDGVASVVV